MGHIYIPRLGVGFGDAQFARLAAELHRQRVLAHVLFHDPDARLEVAVRELAQLFSAMRHAYRHVPT